MRVPRLVRETLSAELRLSDTPPPNVVSRTVLASTRGCGQLSTLIILLAFAERTVKLANSHISSTLDTLISSKTLLDICRQIRGDGAEMTEEVEAKMCSGISGTG